MNILKPKKTNFKTKLGIILQTIFNRLECIDCDCKIVGSTITIANYHKNDNVIINIIDGTVKEIFECKKAKKYCKINYFNDKMYLRFKKVL